MPVLNGLDNNFISFCRIATFASLNRLCAETNPFTTQIILAERDYAWILHMKIIFNLTFAVKFTTARWFPTDPLWGNAVNY